MGTHNLQSGKPDFYNRRALAILINLRPKLISKQCSGVIASLLACGFVRLR
jgi:hypothetical protein